MGKEIFDTWCDDLHINNPCEYLNMHTQIPKENNSICRVTFTTEQ